MNDSYWFNLCSVYILDLTEQKLYWMNYDGDMKSVNVDGFDLRSVMSTNIPSKTTML